MPLQDDYQVSLEAFHGPLDLLLYLIRRAEIDVHDIPIATVTDQYLAFLRQIDDIDIDLAGEFLVMAATLIEIKSRALAPPEKPQQGEGAEGQDARPGSGADAGLDPRHELVRQLLAYQKYRIAAEELEERRKAFLWRFPLKPRRVQQPQQLDVATAEIVDAEEPPAQPVQLEIEDVHVLDLSESFEHIMSSIDLDRLGDHTVEVDDTPIALHQEDLLDRLARSEQRQLRLQDAFEGKARRHRVGLFLAMLELVRLRRILVRQDELAGAITIELTPSNEESPVENPQAAST